MFWQQQKHSMPGVNTKCCLLEAAMHILLSTKTWYLFASTTLLMLTKTYDLLLSAKNISWCKKKNPNKPYLLMSTKISGINKTILSLGAKNTVPVDLGVNTTSLFWSQQKHCISWCQQQHRISWCLQKLVFSWSQQKRSICWCRQQKPEFLRVSKNIGSLGADKNKVSLVSENKTEKPTSIYSCSPSCCCPCLKHSDQKRPAFKQHSANTGMEDSYQTIYTTSYNACNMLTVTI